MSTEWPQGVDFHALGFVAVWLVPERWRDGRVLHVALKGGGDPKSVSLETRVHEADQKVEGGSCGQAIRVTSVGETSYVDVGQGWGRRVATLNAPGITRRILRGAS